VRPPVTGNVSVHSLHRGASGAPAPKGARASEGAHRWEWWSDGAAVGVEAGAGHGEGQRGVPKVHSAKAVVTRAREGRKRGQRRGVHGEGFSGELSQGSSERFPRVAALPRRAKASTHCAKRRRCSEQDEGVGGELWWLG
jgi:hypothetical protein